MSPLLPYGGSTHWIDARRINLMFEHVFDLGF